MSNKSTQANSPASLPESHRDLLAGSSAVTLITMMADGQPQATVVWCTYDGQNVLVNIAARTQKARNLAKNPLATVLAVDPDNDFRYVEVRGRVVALTSEGADEHMDDMSELYTGNRPYYGQVMPFSQKTPRLLAVLEPIRILTFSMDWPPRLD
jgi:PPOX class probable F420-dependent enzyme